MFDIKKKKLKLVFISEKAEKEKSPQIIFEYTGIRKNISIFHLQTEWKLRISLVWNILIKSI